MASRRVFISAGEVSGDALGAHLIREMKSLGDFEFYGLGGKQMFDVGLNSITEDVSTLSTVGFVESLRFILKKIRLLNRSFKFIESQGIDTLILVDNQGFNIPFGRRARRKGILTFFYIPPRVSVWGEWNAPKIPQVADYLIPYLQKDYDIYSRFTSNLFYAGNPNIDKIAGFQFPVDFYQNYNLNKQYPIISIFPGSRHQEIRTLLSIMLDAAKILIEKHKAQILLSVSHPIFEAPILKQLHHKKLYDKVKLIYGMPYAAIQSADVNIMASGTATLESTLFKRPVIICYKVNPITFMIGKRLVKRQMIGLPNILLDRKVFPELLQRDFNPQNIVDNVVRFLDMEQQEKNELSQCYREIRHQMGNPPVVRKVAQFIVDRMNNGKTAGN